MNRITFSLTLLLFLFIFQSCQKESIEDHKFIDASVTSTRVSDSQNSNEEMGPRKLYFYSNSITTTQQEFYSIHAQLINPGVSITNCDGVLLSYNTNNPSNWAQLVENSIKITDETSNTVTFHIEDLLFKTYNCYFNIDFCNQIGNSFKVIKGPGNPNCILGDFIFEGSLSQYININFSSYINNTTCEVAICPGDDGSGGGSE